MDYVHRWSGEYFGWFSDGGLYARDGRHVGFRRRNAVFSIDGRYLGEVRNHRLITRTAKIGTRTIGGLKGLRMVGPTVNPITESPLGLPDGFQDFPDSNSL